MRFNSEFALSILNQNVLVCLIEFPVPFIFTYDRKERDLVSPILAGHTSYIAAAIDRASSLVHFG